MDTDTIWQYLQQHNYFVHHRLYNKFEITIPSYVEMVDIKNKIILDIGCGYGRHLAWFSNYTSKCFGIEIYTKILNEAKSFIQKKGNFKKTQLMLPKESNRFLVPLDYVFCRFVFQHITKQQCQEYMDLINKFLKIEGKVNLQFRLGTQEIIKENREPVIEYTLMEIDKLLENFEINKFEVSNNHAYIIGTKLL